MSRFAKRTLLAGREPLLMHGTVEGGVQPQQARQTRVPLRDRAESCVRHMGDLAGRERHDAVVDPLEDEAVQIDEVAGDMDRCDPALAVPEDLVAPRKARQEELALAWTISIPHHVLALLGGRGMRDDAVQDPLFLIREAVALLELEDEGIGQGAGFRRWRQGTIEPSLPCNNAGVGFFAGAPRSCLFEAMPASNSRGCAHGGTPVRRRSHPCGWDFLAHTALS